MANFTFTCPHCNQEIEAQDEWRGQQANCPTCNELIEIPQKVALKKSLKQEKKSTTEITKKIFWGTVILIFLVVASIVIPAIQTAISRSKVIQNVAFNEQQWKTPIGNIKYKLWESTGDTVYESKSYCLETTNLKDFYFLISPFFQKTKEGKKLFFISFSSNKGYAKKIKFKFSSGKELALSFLDTEKHELQYFSHAEINASDYKKYFVKDAPISIQVSLPLLNRGNFTEFQLTSNQKLAFQDMKSFFGGYEPPQQFAQTPTPVKQEKPIVIAPAASQKEDTAPQTKTAEQLEDHLKFMGISMGLKKNVFVKKLKENGYEDASGLSQNMFGKKLCGKFWQLYNVTIEVCGLDNSVVQYIVVFIDNPQDAQLLVDALKSKYGIPRALHDHRNDSPRVAWVFPGKGAITAEVVGAKTLVTYFSQEFLNTVPLKFDNSSNDL